MAEYVGVRWRDGEPADWHARTEGDRILEEGPGPGSPRAERVLFLDGLVNWHTHVGDAFLAGHDLPRDLDALVRPGTGLKHVAIARAPRETIVAGMASALEAYAARGAVEIFDFREQGPDGLIQLREALRRLGSRAPRLSALGRPAKVPWSAAELPALFHLGDGVGIPSLSDWGREACLALAEAAHRERKLVALHFAEARPEPVEDALALRPHLAVHLCHARPADVYRLADADVAAALCPTSNAFFGLPTPVALVHEAGLRWGFGTDNAMLGGRDLLAEARRAKEAAPAVPDEAIAAALTRRPEKVLNRNLRLETPAPARVALLPAGPGGVAWNAPPRFLAR